MRGQRGTRSVGTTLEAGRLTQLALDFVDHTTDKSPKPAKLAACAIELLRMCAALVLKQRELAAPRIALAQRRAVPLDELDQLLRAFGQLSLGQNRGIDAHLADK